MVFSMTPIFSFAAEGDENDVTETPETTQPVEVEESAEPEVTEETTEPAETDEVTPQTEQEEPEVVLRAKSDDVFVPDSSGEARVEDTSQYSKSMQIYGIYLRRAKGQAIYADEYGDAVLIQSNGKYLLIDTGSNTPTDESGNPEYPSNLVDVLAKIGVKELDVYISHLHGDHHGGLANVCNAFKVNKLYLPDIELCKEYKTPKGKTIQAIYNDQIDIASKEGAEVVYLAPSFRAHAAPKTYDFFTVGAVRCNVIGPTGTYTMKQFESYGEKKQIRYLNNCSLVTVFTCGSFRFLSAGDTEKQEEAKLINRYGNSLNCDMMKLSHHGLGTSNTASFLRKVTPMWTFAEDHGFRNPGSISTAQDYGYNYRVANSKHTFIADINNGLTRIYIDSNNDSRPNERPVTGWVAVKKHYQFYDSAGHIMRGWSDISGNKYYMEGSSGFRITGTYTFNKVKCKFDKNGKLIDPNKPAKTKARSIKAKKKKHKITFRWKKAKRASGYQVFRSTSKNSGYVMVSTKSKKARSYTNINLNKGQTYYYKVRAVRYIAGTTLYGPFSKVKKAKAK